MTYVWPSNNRKMKKMTNSTVLKLRTLVPQKIPLGVKKAIHRVEEDYTQERLLSRICRVLKTSKKRKTIQFKNWQNFEPFEENS